MSPLPSRLAGLLLVLGALGFIVVFAVLAAIFGYPDVLDRPPAEVLPALVSGGASLEAWWIAYALLPLTLVAAALLAHESLAVLGPRARLFTAAGVGAGLAMAVGLLRWSTLQLALGIHWEGADPAGRVAIEAISDGVNRLLGNGLGEVVGEVLLGVWLMGAGLAVDRGDRAGRAVSVATRVLGGAMILGVARFVSPALEVVTELTNVALPMGLIALGLSWATRGPSRLTGLTRAGAATIALVFGVATGSPSRAAGPAEREVILHGFRAPSMGLELREGWLGFHVGLYPTIIDESPSGTARTTWFAKTGVTFYPWRFDTGSGRPSGLYGGVALMQGLGNDWDAAESSTSGSGGFFDLGFRWAAYKGLDLRLGVGVLVGFDGRVVVNPTPGISWAFPL